MYLQEYIYGYQYCLFLMSCKSFIEEMYVKTVTILRIALVFFSLEPTKFFVKYLAFYIRFEISANGYYVFRAFFVKQTRNAISEVI
jgi:hypothetical protein